MVRLPAVKERLSKIGARPSDKGKGIHRFIFTIDEHKGMVAWNTPPIGSKEHLQGYLDEYHFRFNRRNNMDTIFDMLLRRMICQKKTD